jgi:hypothetical protein
MNRKLCAGLAVVGIVSLIAAFLLSRKPGHENDRARAELKALTAKVEQLERNTAALQKELSDFRQRSKPLAALPHEILMTPATAPPAGRTEIPPGWKPFEFNGMTYYITPLKQEVSWK